MALELGVDDLTVGAVCQEAGVSQRTFFHHFATGEDALLGLDLPVLDEEGARRYLSDPAVPALAGLVGLVSLPVEAVEDRATAAGRMRLVGGSPALFQRQAERLLPLLHEVRSLVLLKLTAMSEADGTATGEAELHRQADLVTALGAALVQRIGTSLADAADAVPEDPERLLATLRPIWSRLV